jgi:hypothetical protein
MLIMEDSSNRHPEIYCKKRSNSLPELLEDFPETHVHQILEQRRGVPMLAHVPVPMPVVRPSVRLSDYWQLVLDNARVLFTGVR